MSEPTTAEMIAYCEGIADERARVATIHADAFAQDEARDMLADAAMLRAIAARLRLVRSGITDWWYCANGTFAAGTRGHRFPAIDLAALAAPARAAPAVPKETGQ